MKVGRKGAAAPVLMLLPLTLLAGCGGGGQAAAPKPTDWFTTSTIYAFMRAVQDGNGNVATTVQLRDGTTATASYLYLSYGETLYSSLDIPPSQQFTFNGNLFNNSLQLSQHLKTMSERNLYINYGVYDQFASGKPEYFSEDTPTASSAPTRAYVAFERGQVMVGESSIELPAAFRITAPAADAILPRTAPITLTWTPGMDPTATMDLDMAGSCLDGTRYALNLSLGADTGAVTLNSADYFPATGVSPSTTCRVAFLLQRKRIGSVSSQFAFGSTFTGVQQRTVQFTSTP